MKHLIYAVIMAGGNGERLWPLSTPERPKQFVSVFGRKSLIAHAVDRLRGFVPPENVLIVTSAALAARTRRELAKLPAKNVIAEPCRRNTAAAVALACREIRRRGGENAVGCILTADQLMEPAAEFRRSLRRAVTAAVDEDVIVTLGIVPTYPATGFGYIDTRSSPPTFKEKPDAATAAQFLARGGYLWNSGMFIFREKIMESALRKYAPDIAALIDARDYRALYDNLPSISIDYAVMEKIDNLRTVAASFQWDDVGSWNALADHFPADESGNIAIGRDIRLVDAKNTIVVGEDGAPVAVIGLDNVVVVRTAGATLVCAKDRVQEVKRVVKKTVKSVLALFGLGLWIGIAGTAQAERMPFDRYQSIIDRQMFGQPPPGFDPTRSPSDVQKGDAERTEKELSREQEQVKNSIRFSMINITPSGETAVGFTDSTDSKAPVNYYLKVGETSNGWEVKEADAVKATMTIAKNGVEVSLKLGGDTGGGAGGAARSGAPGGVGGGVGGAGVAARRNNLLANRAGGTGSLRARRMMREEQRAADAAEVAAARAKAEQAEAERAAQAEADRAAREAERDEQRKQLMAIQEELRKAREARAQREDNSNSESAGDATESE